jgi:hypothetical protein
MTSNFSHIIEMMALMEIFKKCYFVVMSTRGKK